jgi:hypothetical protein
VCHVKDAFRLNSKLCKRELQQALASLVCRSHDVFLSLTFMFYHLMSTNFREMTRECREMPFRFIVSCLKIRNLRPEMTTTSE